MMTLNQPTEIELKLGVAWTDVAQLLASPIWKDQEPRALTSIYFDTADQLLRRAGLTLRLRAGIQTLKAIAPEAAGLFERAEWEHPVQGTTPDLTFLAQTPLAAVDLGANQLRPLFLIQVDRRTALINPMPDCQIEMALDIGRVTTLRRHANPYAAEYSAVAGQHCSRDRMGALKALVVGGAEAGGADAVHLCSKVCPTRELSFAFVVFLAALIKHLEQLEFQVRRDGTARSTPQQGVVLVLAQNIVDRVFGIQLRKKTHALTLRQINTKEGRLPTVLD